MTIGTIQIIIINSMVIIFSIIMIFNWEEIIATTNKNNIIAITVLTLILMS